VTVTLSPSTSILAPAGEAVGCPTRAIGLTWSATAMWSARSTVVGEPAFASLTTAVEIDISGQGEAVTLRASVPCTGAVEPSLTVTVAVPVVPGWASTGAATSSVEPVSDTVNP